MLGINQMLSASTSLVTISISDRDFHDLDNASRNIIKDRLEVVRVALHCRHVEPLKLEGCISGSKVLKKVILDGSGGPFAGASEAWIEAIKKLVEACKKKKTVELWKENFTVDGKVDLDADVVSFLMSIHR
jgi:hypothetical protein